MVTKHNLPTQRCRTGSIMQNVRDTKFWARYAPTYDEHIGSREALVLAPRISEDVGAVERVLDVGCGTGESVVALAQQCKQVDGVDLVEKMLDVARDKVEQKGLTNVTFNCRNADALGFDDATFDAVVITNLLHVVPWPKQVLQNAMRVLKPGGKLVAPTYCHGAGLKAHILSRVAVLLYGMPVYRRFSVASFHELVAETGFDVIEKDVVQFMVPLAYVVARKPA